jgi:hypothetical protein
MLYNPSPLWLRVYVLSNRITTLSVIGLEDYSCCYPATVA